MKYTQFYHDFKNALDFLQLLLGIADIIIRYKKTEQKLCAMEH